MQAVGETTARTRSLTPLWGYDTLKRQVFFNLFTYSTQIYALCSLIAALSLFRIVSCFLLYKNSRPMYSPIVFISVLFLYGLYLSQIIQGTEKPAPLENISIKQECGKTCVLRGHSLDEV